MSAADAPISSFDFRSGALRGTHLTLYSSCLVHRGRHRLETIPVSAIAALRIGFDREPRTIGWGAMLLVAAVIVFAVAGPLASLAAAAAREVAAQAHGATDGQNVADVLVSTFRGMHSAARLLPVLGGLLVAGGLALGALGWLGFTTLTLTLGAVERAYPVRGRNAPLFDFAEVLSDHMLKAKR